jgi:phosphate transport system substrate-binding protein
MKRFHRLPTLLGLALAAITVAGCSAFASATPSLGAQRAAIIAHFPTTDGSTTTAPLTRLLACDLYGVSCVWSAPASANIERTYIPDPAANIPDATKQAILNIKFNTTHQAYLNVIDGSKDVILEARVPSADELQSAKDKGVELDYKAFALDAFVFLVNANNPTNNMPLNTLRDIYAGKITTWQDAGIEMTQPAAPIHAYQREANSGSQELLKSMVMNGQATIDAPDMIVQTMLGPFNALGGDPKTGIGGDPLGLCYSVYYYASTMFSNPQVKMISVDGVMPTSATIASRKYGLAAEVYVVTRKGAAADSPGVQFRDWLMSADGQRVVKESGYVPVG